MAMLWGTVAGALCDRVFPAILLGIVFVVGNFAVPILVPIRPELLQIVLAAVPLVLSYRIFCADDMDRLLKVRKDKEAGRQAPYSWQTLLWLAERQGRWIVWPGLAVCFVAGFIVWDYRDYVWPVITLGIGLICGLAVFTPEQTSEQDRFLGAQRFPPGAFGSSKAHSGARGYCHGGPILLGALLPVGFERRENRSAHFSGIALFR